VPRAQPRRSRSSLALCGAIVLLGCSVDERDLQLAPGGSAGLGSSTSPGSSGNGGVSGSDPSTAGGGGLDASTISDAGAAGDAGAVEPAPIPTVDGCADLDMNGVADCQETIVTNPDFKQDTSAWSAETDTTLTWDPSDAIGDASSGSALVASQGVIDADASGAALRAASQCVPVASKQLVTAYANALVDTGQDADGHAEIDVFFFDGSSCQGTFTGSFSTPQPLDAAPGSWITLHAGSVAGNTVKSALVKLAISKPFRAASFQASFDNVLIKVQSP
jgi:hypothetical protein